MEEFKSDPSTRLDKQEEEKVAKVSYEIKIFYSDLSSCDYPDPYLGGNPVEQRF